ncbi:M48 family metalloprotease [Candidatus Dependentiae bacterium]|jgi:Zn-dependent protease with chaperone function|nr:M48 family metalloprotease [Candidatus Dependentiae bacterium]
MNFKDIILLVVFSIIACGSNQISCTEIHKTHVDSEKPAIQNPVWDEIKRFKKEPEVIKQLKIKDSFIKNMAGLIDTVKIANSKDGLVDQALSHFFLNIFPGGVLRFGSEDGLIFLPQDKTPQLHKLVNDLCKKMKIPMPVIFLSGDKKLFNAYATSFSPSLSMVVLGQSLLKKLSYNELKMVLAHELGHVKQSHVPQQITLSLLGSIVAPAALIYFVNSLDDGTRNVGDRKEFVSCLQSWPAHLLIWTGMSVATAVCLLVRGRAFEKEADMIALETLQDSPSFVSMIEKIEDKVLDDKKSFEESYVYVANKLNELSQESPKCAGILLSLLNGHYNTRMQGFNSMLEEETGDHPSCKTRKQYAHDFQHVQENIMNADLSEQELSVQEELDQARVFADQVL